MLETLIEIKEITHQANVNYKKWRKTKELHVLNQGIRINYRERKWFNVEFFLEGNQSY